MTSTAWDGVSDFFIEDDEEDMAYVRARTSSTPPDTSTRRPLSVKDVAARLLESMGTVDAWKLEKLCYLVQGRSLGLHGILAFHEPIEAWTHGPVVDALYQEHRGNRMVESVSGDATLVKKDPVLTDVVDSVVDEYRTWTGRQLRELTHSQQPWLEARAGLSPEQRSRRRLRTSTMIEYFTVLEQLPNDSSEDDNLGTKDSNREAPW